MRVKFQGKFTDGIYFSAKVSNIMSRVNPKLGRTERRQSAASGQSILLLLGTLPWRPASVGLSQFRPHTGSVAAIWASSLVPLSSVAVRLVVAAVSSEIADAAAETALMAVVNSATVAKLVMVVLLEGPVPGVFPGFLSCQSFTFSAGVNLLYPDVE